MATNPNETLTELALIEFKVPLNAVILMTLLVEFWSLLTIGSVQELFANVFVHIF